MADRIAEQRVAPLDRAGDRLGVRIEQQLGRIESMTFARRVRPVHPITVKLAPAVLQAGKDAKSGASARS